jgi:hypothetical protein
MILHDPDSGPTAIEQAIAALPLPGDAAVADGSAPRLFGINTRQAPPSVALELYANSARAISERPQRRDDGPDLRDVRMDPEAEAYALLHPRHLAGEDLLVGDRALLTRFLAPDLSHTLLAEFCASTPDDPDFETKLTDLPLSVEFVDSFSLLSPENLAAVCRRFS